MNTMVEVKKSVPVVAEVDVLVVGGGIAGSTAAVAAARNGAATMLVDRFGYLGGNIGPGMISGGTAINSELPASMCGCMPGIPGEFGHRCEAYTNAPPPSNYFRDSQVISYVWFKMMQESGVRLLLNTFAADPLMDGKKVIGLVVEDKSGTHAIRAKVIVDATGDADVATRAGAAVDDGRGLSHSGVYWAVANVDSEEYSNRVLRKEPDPEDVRWADGISERELGKSGYHLRPRSFTYERLRQLFPYFKPAWESGEYRFIQKIGDVGIVLMDHGIHKTLPNGKYCIFGAQVGVYRPKNRLTGDTAVMNELEIGCRTYIFETAQFLRRRVPGFETSYLHIIAPYFHSRGGRSIVSERPVTVEDVKKGQRLDDVVFVGEIKKHSFDFPYRQFLPKEIDGLLVTGRAAIVQPPSMRTRWMVFLMGQATGVAAALAARADIVPRELNVKELQSLLYHEYQVPLGDENRLQELGLI